jgi:ATP-dependent Clp endopeptidase proteolytic subunit ClpP
MKHWYSIKNKQDKAEIWIYEEIGEDWFTGEGITAKSFQKDLAKITASQIDLHINSPGGVVFDGLTIYNLLKQHPAKITTYIDGLAASISSVIALAGDKVVMSENAHFMIHNPYGVAQGTAADMRKTADILDRLTDSAILAYTGKSGINEDKMRELLDVETWYSAAEALDAGFIDEISGAMDMAACAKFVPVMTKAGFKHIPDNFKPRAEVPTRRDLEHILRDGGCSESMAKSIISGGFKESDQRDVAEPIVDQRDVAAPPVKKDRVSELLASGEKFTLTDTKGMKT